jgi:hypothetical protein
MFEKRSVCMRLRERFQFLRGTAMLQKEELHPPRFSTRVPPGITFSASGITHGFDHHPVFQLLPLPSGCH